MNAHTPGPWSALIAHRPPRADEAGDIAIIAGDDPRNGIIAEVFHRTGETTYQPVAANARLIAAAPELLSALQDLLAACDEWHEHQHVTDDPITKACGSARAAIRKATEPEA